jgi:hypothetical protein
LLAEEFQLFSESGKVGLKNDQGNVVLPPSFEALGWSDGSFSVIGQITGYKLNGNWGLINLKKEYITKAEFESLVFSGADRVVAIKKTNSVTRKSGSLTLTGEITIPFQYDAITLHGLRAVVMNKVGTEYRFGLTDLSNHVIIPVEYNNIYPVSSLRFAVENKKGKTALYADDGKQVTDFFIDSLSTFYRSYAIIFSDNKQGIINRDGIIVANPIYRAVQFKDDGTIKVLQPDNWKIINDQNKEVQSLNADELTAYEKDKYRISKSGKQGLIDRDLHEVWPLAYEYIGDPLNGFIPARKGNKWGLVSADQSEKIPFAFNDLRWDGTFAMALTVEMGKRYWSLFNVSTDSKSAKSYDSIERITDHYFRVRKNGYFGLLSESGNETVHCVYDSILELRNDLLIVKFRNQYGVISTKEFWILPPQDNSLQLVNADFYFERKGKITFLKSFRGDIIYFTENQLTVGDGFLLETQTDQSIKKIGYDGLAINEEQLPSPTLGTITTRNISATSDSGLQLFQGQGKFGFRDSRGRLLIPNRYDSAKPFSEQLAAFKLLGKWGYLNPEDKIIINPAYDAAGEFQGGYAIVARNGRAGLIDKSGVVRLSLNYDFIARLGDKLQLRLKGKTGIAKADGKVLIEPRYDYLRVLPNSQILVGLNGKFGVLSEDGLNVIPIMYKSLEYDRDKNLYLAHLQSDWTSFVPVK